MWAAGGAGFIAALVIVAISLSERSPVTHKISTEQGVSSSGLTQNDSPAFAGLAAIEPRAVPAMQPRAAMKSLPPPDPNSPSASATNGPMIARSASITIQVKDFAAARSALDAIVAKHNGYSATLTVETPESGQRNFQASLRIPSNQLPASLEDLKSLGRVLTESQSGEEVAQQHADLLARLQNSHETEERLRSILQQRTGKIEDVLQVEEEIARVRGEIESMEAEQSNLEHRVDFASVNLQLVEEYKERFDASPVSAIGRLRNGFIDGMRNASGTLLGLALLLEEFGPALLIWCAILGVPAYFIWRRRATL